MRRNKTVIDQNRREDGGKDSGDESTEPCASDNGPEEKEDEWVSNLMLQQKGPQQRHENEKNCNRKGLYAVIEETGKDPGRLLFHHASMINRVGEEERRGGGAWLFAQVLWGFLIRIGHGSRFSVSCLRFAAVF